MPTPAPLGDNFVKEMWNQSPTKQMTDAYLRAVGYDPETGKEIAQDLDMLTPELAEKVGIKLALQGEQQPAVKAMAPIEPGFLRGASEWLGRAAGGVTRTLLPKSIEEGPAQFAEGAVRGVLTQTLPGIAEAPGAIAKFTEQRDEIAGGMMSALFRLVGLDQLADRAEQAMKQQAADKAAQEQQMMDSPIGRAVTAITPKFLRRKQDGGKTLSEIWQAGVDMIWNKPTTPGEQTTRDIVRFMTGIGMMGGVGNPTAMSGMTAAGGAARAVQVGAKAAWWVGKSAGKGFVSDFIMTDPTNDKTLDTLLQWAGPRIQDAYRNYITSDDADITAVRDMVAKRLTGGVVGALGNVAGEAVLGGLVAAAKHMKHAHVANMWHSIRQPVDDVVTWLRTKPVEAKIQGPMTFDAFKQMKVAQADEALARQVAEIAPQMQSMVNQVKGLIDDPTFSRYMDNMGIEEQAQVLEQFAEAFREAPPMERLEFAAEAPAPVTPAAAVDVAAPEAQAVGEFMGTPGGGRPVVGALEDLQTAAPGAMASPEQAAMATVLGQEARGWHNANPEAMAANLADSFGLDPEAAKGMIDSAKASMEPFGEMYPKMVEMTGKPEVEVAVEVVEALAGRPAAAAQSPVEAIATKVKDKAASFDEAVAEAMALGMEKQEATVAVREVLDRGRKARRAERAAAKAEQPPQSAGAPRTGTRRFEKAEGLVAEMEAGTKTFDDAVNEFRRATKLSPEISADYVKRVLELKESPVLKGLANNPRWKEIFGASSTVAALMYFMYQGLPDEGTQALEG